MALVVLLKGLNVGGHRTLRAKALAEELRHLDAVNIGAAGTLVIRQPVSRATLRLEIARRVPFDLDIAICRADDISRLLSGDWFTQQPVRSDMVRFVSVLSRAPRSMPDLPLDLPDRGRWLLRILARQDRFMIGVYRRDMKVIGYLRMLDRLFGAPVTTRNWNTLAAIRKVLDRGRS